MSLKSSDFESLLESEREKIFNRIVKEFKDKALECHIFGSLAKGYSDPYSDLDVWFTVDDKKIENVLTNRLRYYSLIGDVVHVCEAPQNRPPNGVHSFVLFKTSIGLLEADIYLCPRSTSFLTNDSKHVFGDENLP